MDIRELENQLKNLSVTDILKTLSSIFKEKVVFTSSFGIEDQVITDYIFTNNININIISIDTGRLFEQTHKVYSKTQKKYNKSIQILYPKHDLLEPFVSKNGPNSFYNSVDNRKQCCFIRKIEPLQRALAGKECWITGIRSEQSENRKTMSLLEYNETYNVIKVNILHNWSLQEVETYLHEHNVPYNSLHHKGYISIGCAPCTRAVEEGEDFRSGRWWWEQSSKKECGLHS